MATSNKTFSPSRAVARGTPEHTTALSDISKIITILQTPKPTPSSYIWLDFCQRTTILTFTSRSLSFVSTHPEPQPS
ncbi:hypothetical protein HK097_009971 [Rhizophlyctis rosea]|uniref:Uncharacterized protein n=1 Tax=Rhizophlyctis rosea TaxID=64517 RepID=A0AAD5S880_9FUNG|nr:hypothetical protein HK097_009971 [Rhizophlyctis rosea]